MQVNSYPNIQPVKKLPKQPPCFTAKPEDDDTRNKYSGTQLGGATVAAALSAALLVGGISHGMNSKKLTEAYNETSKLMKKYSELESDNRTLTGKIQALKLDNENLDKTITDLKEEIKVAKAKIKNLISGDLDLPHNFTLPKVSEEVRTTKLNYDITKPEKLAQEAEKKANPNAICYEDLKTGTRNRADMKGFEIPKIEENGKFEFEIPMSKDVQIKNTEATEFKPQKDVPTGISANYADAVQWNNDKIARDLLQNFFDGHGQTLDGVKFKFTPTENGNCKIRIEGKSTFSPDKAIYIGESTKRNNANAAGNYGEGLKMVALKLLKDKGASNVKIASNDWNVGFKLSKGDIADTKVLTYSIDKSEQRVNGNFIEFETSDKDLPDTIRKSINKFYHSGNTDFKCPDYENELFGIKTLNENEKGGLYIAGQKFEYEGNYNGLGGMTLFIKQKPPINVLDPSRDRNSLNGKQLEEIAKWLSRETKPQDRPCVIKALDKYITEKSSDAAEIAADLFVKGFNYPIFYNSIKFPEKYVAYSYSSPDVIRDLEEAGYKICKQEFAVSGMRTIENVLKSVRSHKALTPTETELQKIKILKTALNKLSPALKKESFSDAEIDARIHIFDRKAPTEDRSYRDTNAEAIINNAASHGFWIDKEYLNKASFANVLETALHELSHKVGGDSTAIFSYKLTDVNHRVLDEIINSPKLKGELQALGKIWENLE